MYFSDTELELEERYELYERTWYRYSMWHGWIFQWRRTTDRVPRKHYLVSVSYVDGVNVASLHSFVQFPHPVVTPTALWNVSKFFEHQTRWQQFHCDGDGEWIHLGLIMGPLTIMHNVFYIPKVAMDICWAEFFIYCKVTKIRCKSLKVERTKDSDDYQGEILGGLVVQVLLCVVAQRHTLPYHQTTVQCENLGVVIYGNTLRRGPKET